MSADEEIRPNRTAPLGRPGGEIRPKLPVRKREDFSQSLSFSPQTDLSVRGQNIKTLPAITIIKSILLSTYPLYLNRPISLLIMSQCLFTTATSPVLR